VTTLSRVVFAALVLATFGAFFAAQRLKSEPPVVQNLMGRSFFSPNGDGRYDVVWLSFRIKRPDDVGVTIVDERGDAVRTLRPVRRMRPQVQLTLRWDGRDDEGRRARDGRYRMRIVLRREGRAVTVPRSVRLDTRPPPPKVLRIGPQPGRGPELLPNPGGEPARIRLFAPGRRARAEVWRTDGRPRFVTRLPLTDREPRGVYRTAWDGTVGGRPVPAGTYAVVVRARDQAGNEGRSFPRPRGRRLPGRGGITVRYLAVQPPLLPVAAGRPFTAFVDARGAPYRWALRRVGSFRPVARGRHRGPRLVLPGPRREGPGVYVLDVKTRTRSASVPVAVDDRAPHRVLVVLPAITWQGRNPVDDGADGLPNVLDAGFAAARARPFAALPRGFAGTEAPLLRFLDREKLPYDVTTDVALATRRGPRLAGHRGVLLPGETRWVSRRLGSRLRRFTVAGGRVVSLGVDSLRREVTVGPRRLVRPSPAAPADLFGARVSPLRPGPVDLTILKDERIQLFAGEEGLFEGVRAYEETLEVGRESTELASAVTPEGGRVIVAARFGRGLVIRPGIAGFARRLRTDVPTAELMRRMWTLLSG
jgi:flagellar hook assembly protein FlgD